MVSPDKEPETSAASDSEISSVRALLQLADIKHENQKGIDILRNTLLRHATDRGQPLTPDQINTVVERGIRLALRTHGFQQLTQENGSVDIANIIFEDLQAQSDLARQSERGQHPMR